MPPEEFFLVACSCQIKLAEDSGAIACREDLQAYGLQARLALPVYRQCDGIAASKDCLGLCIIQTVWVCALCDVYCALLNAVGFLPKSFNHPNNMTQQAALRRC